MDLRKVDATAIGRKFSEHTSSTSNFLAFSDHFKRALSQPEIQSYKSPLLDIISEVSDSRIIQKNWNWIDPQDYAKKIIKEPYQQVDVRISDDMRAIALDQEFIIKDLVLDVQPSDYTTVKMYANTYQSISHYGTRLSRRTYGNINTDQTVVVYPSKRAQKIIREIIPGIRQFDKLEQSGIYLSAVNEEGQLHWYLQLDDNATAFTLEPDEILSLRGMLAEKGAIIPFVKYEGTKQIASDDPQGEHNFHTIDYAYPNKEEIEERIRGNSPIFRMDYDPSGYPIR